MIFYQSQQHLHQHYSHFVLLLSLLGWWNQNVMKNSISEQLHMTPAKAENKIIIIISTHVLISMTIISLLHILYLYNQKMALLHQQFLQSLSLSSGHHLWYVKALRKCTVLQVIQSLSLWSNFKGNERGSNLFLTCFGSLTCYKAYLINILSHLSNKIL